MFNLTKLLRAYRPNLFGKANVINRSYASSTLQNSLHYRRLPACLTSANSVTSQLRLICTDPSPDMSAASTPSSTPSTPVTEGYYDIRPIQTDDTDQVIQFLRKFFFRDEPLNIEQNLLETDEDTCPELEGYSIKSMHEGISLMAVAPAGDIVGICLNGVMDRQNPDEEEFECGNEKFARILKLLDTVDKEADVFGQFPDVNKIISVKILSVDGSWRGKGIAKALMDRTRELAREMGHTLMRVDCTSHYSARAVARLGFECVYTLKYADYKENGKPVFVPEPPHSEVKVYTQRVA